jgi:hypothetical protein
MSGAAASCEELEAPLSADIPAPAGQTAPRRRRVRKRAIVTSPW